MTFFQKKNLKITPDFAHALDVMEHTNKHVFVTGRAGTGKSTLLTLFRERTKKNVVVLAPTGVAAVNVNGQTIHSFFGFHPNVSFEKITRLKAPDEVYTQLETLVIDEISMVRADLMDCIDKFLRLNGPSRDQAFGGVQLILIGDLYQLPPIVTQLEQAIFSSRYPTPYFFSASAFGAGQGSLLDSDLQLEYIELQKIFRQTNIEFIEILNAVREKTLSMEQLKMLNTRVGKKHVSKQSHLEMYLTTTNREASLVNEQELKKLHTDEYTFSAEFEGEFDIKSIPTEKELSVKVGAQIMMVNNDAQDRWMNGTIGTVLDIYFDDEAQAYAVRAELSNGKTVNIFPHTWDMYHFYFDEEVKKIDSDVVGSYRQYPFRLAWAITIHKSQGKTFDKVVLDIGRGTFSPGQLYVALSRCTSLEGITLIRPIQERHIFLDRRVSLFLKEFHSKRS